MLKAGRCYWKYKAKRNEWPHVRGVCMNVSFLAIYIYMCVCVCVPPLFYVSLILLIHISLWITPTEVETINTLVTQLAYLDLRPQVAKLVSLLPVVLVVSVVPRLSVIPFKACCSLATLFLITLYTIQYKEKK